MHLQRSTLFVDETSNIAADKKKHTTFFALCALSVNKCEFSVYGQDFHEMHARLRCSNTLSIT